MPGSRQTRASISEQVETIVRYYQEVFNDVSDAEWNFLARKTMLIEYDEEEYDEEEYEEEEYEEECDEEFDEEFGELTDQEQRELQESIASDVHILYCSCEEAYLTDEPSTTCIGSDENKSSCALNPLADFSFGENILKSVLAVKENDARDITELVRAVFQTVPILHDNADISELFSPGLLKPMLLHVIYTISAIDGNGYWHDYSKNHSSGFLYVIVDMCLKNICEDLSKLYADVGTDNCAVSSTYM